MYTVSRDFRFAAAHRIEGHPGECRHLHGHNYRVRVHLGADVLDSLGMVLDFADLKQIMARVLDRFDHRVINEIPPFDRRSTTAESLSEYVFREVEKCLPEERIRILRVEVWENESSCAVFEPTG